MIEKKEKQRWKLSSIRMKILNDIAHNLNSIQIQLSSDFIELNANSIEI